MSAIATPSSTDLASEAIAVRIRWFGLCMGYLLVNLLPSGSSESLAAMNAILTLGASFTLLDTYWSLRGRVLLKELPLLISIMEAVFIGLLCRFDNGPESPFRFYYFLSLLVSAMRNSPQVTLTTFLIHCVSYVAVGIGMLHGRDELLALASTLVFMGWVTWASTALSTLLKNAGRRLAELNETLRENQSQLEDRIGERTQQLQESQALVVQQEKQAAFGLLAAGIAHEVGNPLAAISSLVQLLSRRPNDDYTRERLLMVDDQLRRIQGILRELVNFSRPATSRATLADVHEVLGEALNIAKYYKRTKGKRIVTHFSENLPMTRLVRDQLVQVYLNLILNAMDATEEGGTIEITTALEEGWISTTIRDDGQGISEANQLRVFRPYFTTKETGTGLGLFVCRRIMEQTIGGTIDLVDSSPEGTTFAVRLPAVD